MGSALNFNQKISQDGSTIYAASSAGSDAYAITLVPAVTAYVTGQLFNFKTDVGNTGAATLNVNGLGAKTIKKNLDQDLQNNDIKANQTVTVVYDGTNFQMQSQLGLLNGSVLLSTKTASSSASITFTSADNFLGYAGYLIYFYNVVPATDGVALYLRTSTNDGSSYNSGASDYSFTSLLSLSGTAAQVFNQSSAAAQIPITNPPGSPIGNLTDEGGEGQILILNPAVSGRRCVIQSNMTFWTPTPVFASTANFGGRNGTGAVNAVQLLMSSGNIASGTFKLYGIN